MSDESSQPVKYEPSVERRSVLPTQEGERHAFEKTAKLIHRYSLELFEQNDPNEFIVPDEKVIALLRDDIKDLKKQDPLINLFLNLRRNHFEKDEELKVGVYRLVNPTIKQLNDIYLGPEQTDLFISELHQEIEDILQSNNATLLNANYKGGSFLLKNGFTNQGENQQRFEEKIRQIQRNADQILLGHIERRLEKLNKKYQQDKVDKIKENINFLEDLKNRIGEGSTGVKIAIGFEDCNKNEQEAFFSLRNAECAANLACAELRKNNDDSADNISITHYHEEDILIQIIRATQDIALETLDENGKLKAEWGKFFFVDGKTGYIRMQKEMINIYRRLEKYLLSDDFENLTPEAKAEFLRKIEIFEKYYLTINIIDVVKNFRAETFDYYLEKVKTDVDLIDFAEREIEKPFPDSITLRRLAFQISTRLETSIKDEGQGIIKTNRATIRTILEEPGAKLILSADNIGFGGDNQQSYEKSALKLVDLLGISEDEWQMIDGDQDKLKKVITQKLDLLKDKPEYKQTILAIGDEGTQRIRNAQRLLHKIFKGSPVINGEGGDETVAVYSFGQGCELPELDIIKKKLLSVSQQIRIRIAGVYTDMGFSPFNDYNPPAPVSSQTRKEIIEYNRAKSTLEFAQSEIKAMNEINLHKVIIENLTAPNAN